MRRHSSSSRAQLQFILLLASSAVGTAFQPSPCVRGTTHQRVMMCDGTHGHREEGPRLPERRVLPRRGAAVLLPTLGFMAGATVRGAAAEDGAARQGLDKAGLKKDYDRYSASYEVLDGGVAAKALGVDQARDLMIEKAQGAVLEVGVGTGLNLQKYTFSKDGGRVETVVGIDLSLGMLSEARGKAEALGLSQVSLVEMDVERLSFPDASFDTVLDSYSLCVFSDPVKALSEMRRVCKPGGRILLLENSISDIGAIAWYQKATAPAVAAMGGKGCFYDQDVAALVQEAGLRIVSNTPVMQGGFLRFIEATP